MSRRESVLTGFFAGALVAVLAVSVVGQPADSSDALMNKFFEPLATVVQQVRKHHVEEVPLEELRVGAYRGMMEKLDDYSTYIPADRFDQFKEDTQGEFGGLGIQITFNRTEKVIEVEQPIPGTPAFAKGILAGDKIIRIKDEATGEVTPTTELESVHDAVDILRGEVGTKVTITVVHENRPEEPQEITIERANIEVPGVRAVRVIGEEPKLGYLHLANFNEETVEEMDRALSDLQEKGVEGLILDLRFNPGGLLKTAVDVSDRFLADGTIVSTRGRSHTEKVFEAESQDSDLTDIPVVVLVNNYSASASEIVTGALKDNNRAMVVGEKTFGKGSVQSLIRLPKNDGALKLTTARYYTPSGVCIDEIGVKPDISVELSDEESANLARHLSDQLGYSAQQKKKESEQKSGEKSEQQADDGEDGEDAEEDKENEFRDIQLQRAEDILQGVLMHSRMLDRRKAVAQGQSP
ncbi:MAG: S41 family peptidase [Planctomycetota bacterium]